MPVHDELGKRMKSFYEGIPQTKLMRRCPVIIRIDGKAFHTFTRGFKKPFDDILMGSMQDTMKYLCENIQGCVLGYTQSDEISLLLLDYAKLNTAAWFDYEVQKICSISASMATMAFNKAFSNNTQCYVYDCCYDPDNGNIGDRVIESRKDDYEFSKVYMKALERGAMFDARCFNIPKEEVANYFYWRQLDATRNSVQMVGHTYFSDKELLNMSCNQIQNMLLTQKDINWNDFKTSQKRGSCAVKDFYYVDKKGCVVENIDCRTDLVRRSYWKVDTQIPVFSSEGRDYIEKLVFVGE